MTSMANITLTDPVAMRGEDSGRRQRLQDSLFRGTTVFFVHPKSRAENPFGFLIEIVEDPKDK